jgi:REP element-mobilizing transposase RayT
VFSKSDQPFLERVVSRHRGYLPHWENQELPCFVTFRLADSLPSAVLVRLRADVDHIRDVLFSERQPFFVKRAELARRHALALDGYLDAGHGECFLRNPQIAEVVREALLFFEGKKYRLFAWVIMPNHVHVLLTVFQAGDLAKILHSWKSFTAHEANKILMREGQFWQREYFDRLVRDEEDFEATRRYILRNPEKAGLSNWPWVSSV